MGTQVILKPYEVYNRNKIKFNRNNRYNEKVKKLISKIYVGDMSYLFKKYNPSTMQEFADKYFNDYDEDNYNSITLLGLKKCGRSYEQFSRLAKRLQKDCYNEPTFEECFDNLICHTIVETFQGQNVENIVIDKLKSTGLYKIESQSGDMDSEFGVDILATNINNNKKTYIQIKPYSTFGGDANKSLVKDRINFFSKEIKLNNLQKSLQLDVKPIEYMCYNYDNDGTLKWLTLNGKKRFHLCEICNTDGTTKIGRTTINNYNFTTL